MASNSIYGNKFIDIDNFAYFVDPSISGVSAILNGSVGIGTTTPGSYKLNVNGNANIATNLNVGGTVTLTGTNVGTGTTALMIDSTGTISQRSLGNLAFQDSHRPRLGRFCHIKSNHRHWCYA